MGYLRFVLWEPATVRQRTYPSGRTPLKEPKDVEKIYSTAEFVAKLRRLADSLETGQRFEIQIAGERIYVPVRATFSVEHERSSDSEEIEFQLKWSPESE
jgi:amphi-Trp domain-containing protein